MLALMIGGGLRRREVATLEFEDIQLREARWVIVTIRGALSRGSRTVAGGS